MRMQRLVGRCLVAGLLAAVPIGTGATAGAAGSGTAGIRAPLGPLALLAGTHPATASPSGVPVVPTGALDLGAAPVAQPVALDVVLRPRSAAALAARAAAVSEPGSPLYRHYLTTAQFAARFAPDRATDRAVESALRSAGLNPGALSANGLVLSVTATVGQAERGLHTSVLQYRLVDGRMAIDNQGQPQLPASIAGDVQAVLGLDTVVTAPVAPPVARRTRGGSHTTEAPAAAGSSRAAGSSGPTACSAATDEASDSGGYTDPQLAKAYEISGLYAKGQLGAKTTVALFEIDPYDAKDLSTFQTCFGTSVKVTGVNVDGGDGTGAGEGESTLDIETVIGLAPKAALRVYEAPGTNYGKSTMDEYTKIVSDNDAQVLSSSYGICEREVDEAFPGLTASENTTFEEAANQGMSVFVASGDTGSEECYPNGGAEGVTTGPKSEPVAVTVDPAYHTSYVADFGTGTLAVVDDTDGSRVALVSLGSSSGPSAVAIDTATHEVLVTLSTTGKLAELSSATCNATKTSGCSTTTKTLGSGTNDLEGIAVDSATGTAYVPLQDHAEVAVVKVAGLGVVTDVPSNGTDPYAAAVDATADEVYVTNIESNTVARIDGATCNASTTKGCSTKPPTTAVGEEPSSVTVDHAAGQVFVAAFKDSSLSVDSTSTGKQLYRFDLSGFSLGLTDVALSPDGGHVLVPVVGGADIVEAGALVIGVDASPVDDPLTGILDAGGSQIAALASDTADGRVSDADYGDNEAVLLPLALAVSDPSSQPYVTAVGGTDLTAIGPAPTESTWNEAVNDDCGCQEGAGTGGISSAWAMPSWQKGPGVDNSYTSAKPCGASSGDCREVPDVSASADPVHGYVVYHSGEWQSIGGTSAATPLWAAMVAVIESKDATPKRQGFLNPRLYSLGSSHAAAVFNDVTKGTNDYVGTHGGAYPATKAYDQATGLGTPIATGIQSLLPAP